METPLVSIIIPVYNGEKYLSQAIESALSQTYQNLEVIVVNDGSTDGGKTRGIARKYGSRIRYFEKENGGVATALNAGIAMMKGECFSWLSHDDMYYPDKIERQVGFYVSSVNKKIIVYSHEDIIDESGNIIRKAEKHPVDNRPLPYVLLFHSFIGGCSLLIPRSAFTEAGLFNPDYRTVQDYDLWFRMIAKGYEFAYCEMTSGMSRRHPEQDSKTKIGLHQIEKEVFFEKVLKELPTKYWLDRITDKEGAMFRLAAEYSIQGLVRPRRYCLAMLSSGMGRESVVGRIVSVARYRLIQLRTYLNQIKKKVKRKIRSTMLGFRQS